MLEEEVYSNDSPIWDPEFSHQPNAGNSITSPPSSDSAEKSESVVPLEHCNQRLLLQPTETASVNLLALLAERLVDFLLPHHNHQPMQKSLQPATPNEKLTTQVCTQVID